MTVKIDLWLQKKENTVKSRCIVFLHRLQLLQEVVIHNHIKTTSPGSVYKRHFELDPPHVIQKMTQIMLHINHSLLRYHINCEQKCHIFSIIYTIIFPVFLYIPCKRIPYINNQRNNRDLLRSISIKYLFDLN